MSLSLSPLQRYRHDLQQADFSRDVAQQYAVGKLEELYHQLLRSQPPRGWRGFFCRWQKLRGVSVNTPLRGLYFWGGVGRGKTYLMDMFYDTLPFEGKQRLHFHRFMRRVHHRLTALQGEKNPLEKVAAEIAGEARVLCFDEFFVSDIADAMLLSGLFEELFARGITLVATSNIAPDSLYRNGLQRERFLPAIALINQHTEVIHVDGGSDYRLRTLQRAELYHWPLDASADDSLMRSFQQLAPNRGRDFICVEADCAIEIEGRDIIARYLADDVVWFEFEMLCGGPRSQNDYIELAREFHAVLISNVPQMGGHNESAARRFVNLVDEFYDHNIKVVLSAEVALPELYGEGRLSFEFQRTISRLQEMQSQQYLAAAHKA